MSERNSMVLTNEETARCFEWLYERWDDETGWISSSMHKRTQHPAYRLMVSLGEMAVYAIMPHLRSDPYSIGTLLGAITGHSPYAEPPDGDEEIIIAAWERWAIESGYMKELNNE